MANNNKRYICSFIKEIDGELKRNVVIITASNNIIARAMLCEQYGVENIIIHPDRQWKNDQAGIKTIRLSDTNTYVDDKGIISHYPRI
ncbi:MAG: hypothetical protein ACTSQF_10135 [Candidatus Heimdallarchaeaceae archaeon]